MNAGLLRVSPELRRVTFALCIGCAGLTTI